ncbi:EAL domain-containing protein [Candidatus Contubernalis alkaliaceticus]|uniref:EAL domain-containing protein n=1 Tax=Candidatus Contubernalis alkaliaceticus TaxID=338645 RepID=UPI001F4BE640|nr:EAL domain-containing protein [Candidatus Contubernalis alkalaceticus]UNC92030.1 EAL domain-containing protein [Candidatus Contubernalis alkalaceticus]
MKNVTKTSLLDDLELSPVSLQDNLLPYFQAIVCVNTLKVIGYEALGRKISTKGIESLGPYFHNPDISVENKIQVDRILRKKSIEAFSKIDNSHHLLFLNIQPQWIYLYKDSPQKLPTINYLQRYGISGEQIVIEISESEFVGDITLLNNLISRYRSIGCRIAIDDVGCGFSNFDRIAYLHPDYLKIDASIVQHSSKEELTLCLLESLGIFAQRMGIDLIFEGIENDRQFSIGLHAGARYYQGFFFSHPSPDMDEKNNWVNNIEVDLESRIRVEGTLFDQQMKLSKKITRLLRHLSSSSSFVSQEEYITVLLNVAPLEWFRIYICNNRGFQITPNYCRSSKKEWKIQPEYINHYWGWRPYYVPTLVRSQRLKRAVFSESYLDMESSTRVYTFCYPLDLKTYIFIDVRLPHNLHDFL